MIYVIETKGNNMVSDKNVRLKQKATLQWLKRINDLPKSDRMGKQWRYILLSEDNFYSLSGSGATLEDICQRCAVSLSAVTGNLFEDY